jgi:Ferritin-like
MELVQKRNRLASLLVAAAELEHTILCQYLFVAFSMKHHPDEGGVTWAQLEQMRRWEATLLLIARQEMEHLALVSNLLTAIGEAPHFARPNFPIPSRYFPVHDPGSLEPFGRKPLRRLIRLEQPARAVMRLDHRVTFAEVFPAKDMAPERTVGQLYEDIEALFKDLNAIDPKSLFIGPPSAQRTTLDVIPVPLRGISLPPNPKLYDIDIRPVKDIETALSVIYQIIKEGEGIRDDPTSSHFSLLVQLADELKREHDRNPTFEPARFVLINPKRARITNETTRSVYDLFEEAYETVILMLVRYFGQTDETLDEVRGLQQAVFFPMMTTVIRPLAEILTQLPVRAEDCIDPADGSILKAGPSFQFERRLGFLPHRQAAWRVIDMQLRDMTEALEKLIHDYVVAVRKQCAVKKQSGTKDWPSSILERLQLTYQNMARIRSHFCQAMQLPV